MTSGRVTADPTTPILDRARAALKAGRVVDCHTIAMTQAARDPHNAEARFLLGVSEAMRGDIRGGVERMRESLGLAPSAECAAHLARYLLLMRLDDEARSVLASAKRCLAAGERAEALTLDTIGCAYARLGAHEDSLPHFAQAVRSDPANSQFRYNHAIALSFVGDVAASEKAFEALLARDPGHARAHHGLAGLQRQTVRRNHIPRLRARLAAARESEDRLLLGYALAKELEDTGAHQDAFACLIETNRAHRSRLAYDGARDAAIFDAIEASWPSFAATPVTRAPTAQPVFIIGMPRTGTTLVDRILSSHPDMVSAGELQAFPLAVKAASGTRTRVILDPETLHQASGKDPGGIGRAYLERAAAHLPGTPDLPDTRFIDKFPGNFLYAGLIAHALPKAPILCLRRHPMDTVVSNFRNLFATTSRYYDYSYDIAEIATYYVRFDRLMRFWQSVLPGRILEIRYEDLVEDQEGTTRRMLAHCGLDWSETCMDFHTNNCPVSTPSAAQVRRPIYRDALDRWRRHEPALEPARRIFEAAGIRV